MDDAREDERHGHGQHESTGSAPSSDAPLDAGTGPDEAQLHQEPDPVLGEDGQERFDAG